MDYRLTQYEDFDFLTLKSSKEYISNMIDKRVQTESKVGQHYEKINSKNGGYYKLFENAYNSKCAYCGIDTSINPTTLFEIDHFINKTQNVLPNGHSVNSVENLIFSCRRCNQAKDDFNTLNLCDILHPDHDLIANVFIRTATYGISVKEEYKENSEIVNFYKKLHLDSNFKKLDFLLMNLKAMKKIATTSEMSTLILKLYSNLLEMRNRTI